MKKHMDNLIRSVQNRNEKRVLSIIVEELEKIQGELYAQWTDRDLMDIYAYSLNHLLPRYAVKGTIIVNDPVRPEAVRGVVAEAIRVVRANPKD